MCYHLKNGISFVEVFANKSARRIVWIHSFKKLTSVCLESIKMVIAKSAVAPCKNILRINLNSSKRRERLLSMHF